MKTILISIFLDKKVSLVDLSLRHVIVDTLEIRKIGEVTEVTSSSRVLEIVIESFSNNNLNSLDEILKALGFNQYTIEEL